ncbi:MAG: 3-isopropylmalate dehydrogenase [Rubricoccaceae bacterium]
MSTRTLTVALLPGDGVGPEVTAEAARVLAAATEAVGVELATSEHPVGGAGLDASGDPLPRETLDACLAADAVFLGAVGGPKWDNVDASSRPERGLLRLRSRLGAFANLRPVSVASSMAHRSPLRKEVVAGTDLLIVRELTGGIYFGTPREKTDTEAFDTMRYADTEIERIARVAFEWARRRSGRVASVDKANVLASSALWRETVEALHIREFSDVELEHFYVDNAAMQIVRDPKHFDVVVTGNLFGDILSDLAATLPGSLGLLPSASVGGRVGLFEPVHGSAPDIAGQRVANPLAAIQSAAMLLDTVGHGDAATAIRGSVARVLADGPLTPDLGGSATTGEVGEAVAEGLRVSATIPA